MDSINYLRKPYVFHLRKLSLCTKQNVYLLGCSWCLTMLIQKYHYIITKDRYYLLHKTLLLRSWYLALLFNIRIFVLLFFLVHPHHICPLIPTSPPYLTVNPIQNPPSISCACRCYFPCQN